MKQKICTGIIYVVFFALPAYYFQIVHAQDVNGIRPYADNAYYWQYKGEPVLLLGASWQDNLFNHPVGLERHLDLLLENGGNYVRNTMSHRNTGNVFAYAQTDGKYDLDRFNEEYWQRFEDFLKMTHDRDIIVQIEVFDLWDLFEDHEAQGGWSGNPYNPANNINYTETESGLPMVVDYAPGEDPSDHPFYCSVPDLDNICGEIRTSLHPITTISMTMRSGSTISMFPRTVG